MSAERSETHVAGERRRGLRSLRILLVVAFFYMCRRLLVPLVLGAVVAVALEPLREWLTRRLKRAGFLGPMILTTLVLLLVVIPASALTWKAVDTANGLRTMDTDSALANADDAIVARIAPWIDGAGVDEHEIRERLHAVTGRAISALGRWAGTVARELPNYLVTLLLFLVSLYYFSRDGRRVTAWLRTRSPVGPDQTDDLMQSIRGTIRGTILGMLLVCLVQGALTTVAMLAFQVPRALLWGIVAAVLSVLPIIGTAPVTTGAVLYLAFSGRVGSAIGMIIAAVVVGVIDNLIRSAVVSSHDDAMHPLVALLAIFGGLSTLGASGIVLGPITASIALWAMKPESGIPAVADPARDGMIV